MKMVDVGKKDITVREAVVRGSIRLKPAVIRAIKQKKIPKGDVLEAAKVAGILAVKNTPHIIPLCHPVPIEYVTITFSFLKTQIEIRTTVRGRAKTGVEMEALTATAIAALTVYDMCKAFDRAMTITTIELLKKSGGKSGTYEKK